MRRRAFMGFVACWVALLFVGSFADAAEDLHVTGPTVHANLAIYFVHGSATTGAVPVSLEEALASGRVKVRETGTVNELTVENLGDDEVFVQAGDIVKGGRQDRVLSVDLLLPPRSGQVSIAAFCVEVGRWFARGREDAQTFSTAATAMPSHEARLAMQAFAAAASSSGQTVASDPTGDDVGSRQKQIWTSVTTTQDRLAQAIGAPVTAPASPSSLELSLESEKLRAAQAAYLSALQDKGLEPDVVGFLVAINGKISGGDIYASPALFHKMWPKLLAASATEAIIEADAQKADPPPAEQLAAMLTAAQGAPETERQVGRIVRLATRYNDGVFYSETRRPDGSWVHRNYLAK